MSAEQCAQALSRARTDNDRVAALLLAGRRLWEFADPEAVVVLRRVDFGFLVRMLDCPPRGNDEGESASLADSAARASVGASIVRQLAARDPSGTAARGQEFDRLLGRLCVCCVAWQRAAATDGETVTSAVARQLREAVYCGIGAARFCPGGVSLTPELLEVVRMDCALKAGSLKLGLLALKCCPPEKLEATEMSQLFNELLEFYTDELAGLFPANDLQKGNPKNRESQEGNPNEGESCDGNPGSVESPPLSSRFLPLTLTCHLLDCAPSSDAGRRAIRGRLLPFARARLPALLGHVTCRSYALALVAKLSHIFDGLECVLAESDDESDNFGEFDRRLHLVGSLSALEVELRMNLADCPEAAFRLAASSFDHQEVLGAAFALLEESLRLLDRPRLDHGQGRTEEALVGRISDALELLANRYVAACQKLPREDWTTDSWLFALACLRCLCAWLCSVGGFGHRLVGEFLDASGRLLERGFEDGVVGSASVDCARPLLTFLCGLLGSGECDTKAETMKPHCRRLVEQLMSHWLGRILAAAMSGEPSEAELGADLALFSNALLNLILPLAQADSAHPGQLWFSSAHLVAMVIRLAESLPGLREGRRLAPREFLSAAALSIAGLKLALKLDSPDANSKGNPEDNPEGNPKLTFPSDCAHNLVSEALTCIDLYGVAVETSNQSGESDDADEVDELLVLMLHLTAELLCEFPANVRHRDDPIPRLLRRLKSLAFGDTDADRFATPSGGQLMRELSKFIAVLDALC